MTIVLIGKDLVLEDKQPPKLRTKRFQVCIGPVVCEFLMP